MATFAAAHAAARDWHEAAGICLHELDELQASANLGFLYVTDALAAQMPQILRHFREETGVERWVGAVGVSVLASGREYDDTNAIAVMLAALPPDSFRVFGTVTARVEEFAERHGRWCREHQARFAVVHGDPRNPRTPELIAELSESIGGYLVGGITSSRGHHYQIADRVTQGGLSGVLFAADVPVAAAHTQGCSPLGPPHEITECQNNIAIRLDGRPALDVFNEDAGDLIARDPAHAAGYVFAGLPVRGSDTGDYVVRNLMGIDRQRRLVAIGADLAPGDTIMFCRRDSHAAHADLLRVLDDLRRRAGRPPRGGVYYSCLGRGQRMFGQDSAELRVIEQQLGAFPLVGFFANGEISHNRLYGYTGVLTLFL